MMWWIGGIVLFIIFGALVYMIQTGKIQVGSGEGEGEGGQFEDMYTRFIDQEENYY